MVLNNAFVRKMTKYRSEVVVLLMEVRHYETRYR
jgi:hypothetical protein